MMTILKLTPMTLRKCLFRLWINQGELLKRAHISPARMKRWLPAPVMLDSQAQWTNQFYKMPNFDFEKLIIMINNKVFWKILMNTLYWFNSFIFSTLLALNSFSSPQGYLGTFDILIVWNFANHIPFSLEKVWKKSEGKSNWFHTSRVISINSIFSRFWWYLRVYTI